VEALIRAARVESIAADAAPFHVSESDAREEVGV
jgi:hypothetical protein